MQVQQTMPYHHPRVDGRHYALAKDVEGDREAMALLQSAREYIALTAIT